MKIGIIIVTIILCVLLVFAAVIGVIFLGMANYDKYLKNELDNPYINSSYSDWKPVTLDDYSMYVPEQWQLQKDADIYYVTDKQNNTPVCCVAITSESSSLQDSQDILTAYLNDKVHNITATYPSNVITIGGSSFNHLDVQTATQHLTFYHLYLRKDFNSYCKFYFPADNVINYDELTEIAQAIIYSYSFYE